MTAISEQLFETAMALGDEERLALAERLMESVHDDPEIFAEQLAVSRRRLQEILSGEVETVSEETAFQMIREAASKRHR
jgi:hypothetical protein